MAPPTPPRENLSEALPAPQAYKLDGKESIAALTAAAGPLTQAQSDRFTQNRVWWVHSREHCRVNSGERQGSALALSSKEAILRLIDGLSESELEGPRNSTWDTRSHLAAELSAG